MFSGFSGVLRCSPAVLRRSPDVLTTRRPTDDGCLTSVRVRPCSVIAELQSKCVLCVASPRHFPGLLTNRMTDEDACMTPVGCLTPASDLSVRRTKHRRQQISARNRISSAAKLAITMFSASKFTVMKFTTLPLMLIAVLTGCAGSD